MAIVQHPNGYGLRESPPECRQRPERVPCPCCGGHGEHAYGEGMDADTAPCRACRGYGELTVSAIEEARSGAGNGR